jgi:hypothetical protein
MEGTKNELVAIASQAKADGSFAKDQIEKIYGATLGDVLSHHKKVKASFGKQTSALIPQSQSWRIAGSLVLILSFGFLFFSIGNIGGREHGGIHRAK